MIYQLFCATGAIVSGFALFNAAKIAKAAWTAADGDGASTAYSSECMCHANPSNHPCFWEHS